jgi:hypothetical protein
VQINATGIVDFYKDGKLKASSTVPLDLKSYLDTRFQHSGQKNIAPHLIDDITISIPETGDLALFDSEVDNYTLVSIDPPVDLPPEPLKGLVRITAKVLPFVDFDSDSALVFSLTSLSENLGLGPGSIQVAVPETVNPVYDSIQTEWTYDNPNCGGPVTLGIPQIDCDDPDVLANLLLQLYPPIGSAVISSLGLQSSVQCAGNSNNPYAGTLFEAYNTHDTLNYLWYDPAASACAGGEPYDGKEIEIFIPISGEISQVLEDLDESLMALNVRFQVIIKSVGEVFEVDILTDPIGP